MTNPMSTPPQRRNSQGVAETVINYLRDGIREGRFVPGQRLVEVDLTRDLEVSRGSVREALGKLSVEGLVEITPHRGATVRRMSRRDVSELFAARKILEGGVARLAADQAADTPQHAALVEALEEQRRWTEATDIPGYAEANERVHNLLIEVSDNGVLADLVGQLHTKAWRSLVRGYMSVEAVRRSSRQHVAILEAVTAGDGDAAERLMREHIQTTEDSSTWNGPPAASPITPGFAE